MLYICSFLITCGPDGDVRVYHGFEDDDPVSHKIGDVVHFVAYKVIVPLFA
jgi:hypothetical protein